MPAENDAEQVYVDSDDDSAAAAPAAQTAPPPPPPPAAFPGSYRGRLGTPRNTLDDTLDGDSPIGWTFYYSEILDTGDKTAELHIPDCFDPARAAEQIAKWKGVGRYKYHTAAPQGRLARNYVPTGIDASGEPVKCPRRGTLTISGADVIAWFGYNHVPGGNPRNLRHREGFDDPADSAPAPVAPGDPNAAILQELRRLNSRPQAPAAPSFDAEFERDRRRREAEREERRIEREERLEEEARAEKKKREEEELARKRKREEQEDEDRRRKIRFEEELQQRRAEADEQRIKDDAAHRRRIEERREQFQEEMRLREQDRKDSGGDSFGLLGQIKDMIDDEGGIIGLLRGAMGGGDRDDSIVGQIERAAKSVKEVVGLGRLVPTPAAPVAQLLPPPAAAAPAPNAQVPQHLAEPDAPTHPAFFMPTPGATDGSTQTVARVPSGAWGLRQDPKRTDLPLIALDKKVWAALDQELARLQGEATGQKPPAPPKNPGQNGDGDDDNDGEGDDDFPLADEGSLMWWRMLSAAAPELVSIAETIVDQIGIAIESQVIDHRVMNVALMRAFRQLSDDEKAKVRVRLADASTIKLVQDNLPKLMPKDQRNAAADPQIERAVEELLTAFRQAVNAPA